MVNQLVSVHRTSVTYYVPVQTGNFAGRFTSPSIRLCGPGELKMRLPKSRGQRSRNPLHEPSILLACVHGDG